LSDHETDQSLYVLNLPLTDQFVQSTKEPTRLSDLSERDKVWDEHRANSDKVSDHYKSTEFGSYAKRMYFCSDLLDFKLTPDADEGVLKLKLASARFCRVRHCPVCQWRRSMRWKAKAYRIIPKIVEDFPKHRWLFLTLTVKNCPVKELRETLNLINRAFQRLSQLKIFPAEGWIKSVEVTHGKDGNAHPHLHCLLMVPSSYFGANYLSQKRWAELWQQSARLDYLPRCHVKAISKNHNPTKIVPEILKYQVKESDMIRDRSFFLELTRQLHNTKAVGVGGVLRHYLKALEQEPEDLVGKDETETAVDEGHLYFEWERKKKKYELL
jgi:plasmid rolling circle replication initiator protein Rep